MSIIYPGASPDVVEREVVDQIEEAIAGISGVDRMRSSSLDSFASILVEFDFSKDPRLASQEIRDKISGIRNELPTEMEEPVLTQFDPADQPIVSLTLSSAGLGSAELTRLADPGHHPARCAASTAWRPVNLAGAVERELVVELRPRDLQASGVGVGQVVQALQSQNLAVPVGRLEGELDERTIRLKGRLDQATEFKDIIVVQTGGRIVRLGRRGRRQGRNGGAAILRPLQRRRGGGHQHPEVHGLQHHGRGRGGARARGRDPGHAAGRRHLAGRAGQRRARGRFGGRRPELRSSRARRSPSPWCSCSSTPGARP